MITLKNKPIESSTTKTKPAAPLEAIPHVNLSKATEKKPLGTESASQDSSKKKGPTTKIIVKFDIGFNNSIYLRGEGAELSWERGIILKNIKADEWIWETSLPFTKCEFKVLINDRQYELGENHQLKCGTAFEYTPLFHNL